MSLRTLRAGMAALLLLVTMLTAAPAAQAQDAAALASTANTAMQRMLDSLSAALAAPNSTAATASVSAAIAAGEEAVVALQALQALATVDVVRSRAKASLDQTSSAVNKARAAIGASPDVFNSQVQAAFAEVEEAIEEFAPVLQIVGSVPSVSVARALPRAGAPALDRTAAVGLVALGLIVALAGLRLRRREPRLA